MKALSLAAQRAIRSVKEQSYERVELVVVVPDAEEAARVSAMTPSAVVVSEVTGKNRARNEGVAAAQGEFIFLLDDDMWLPPDLLSTCVAAAEAGADAVVVPEERPASSNSLLLRAVELEARTASHHPAISAPRFVRRALYTGVGGIDEHLDPIDEGDLAARLDEHRVVPVPISTSIIVDAPFRLRSRVMAKFRRGQKVTLFAAHHPTSRQFHPLRRGLDYIRSSGTETPGVRATLVGLKLLDLFAIRVGVFLTPTADRRAAAAVRLRAAAVRNREVFDNEAESYECEFYERTEGSRHVAQIERDVVTALLPHTAVETSIDLGSGGGRWSRLLGERYPDAVTISMDLSLAMLRSARRPAGRHHRVQADMVAVPARSASADLVLSVRSMKYASDVPTALREVTRLVRQGGCLVVELPYPSVILRWLRVLPASTGLGDYARRITAWPPSAVAEVIEEQGLVVQANQRLFATPATLWRKTNSKVGIACLAAVDRFATRSPLARSFVIAASRPAACDSGSRATPSTMGHSCAVARHGAV